MPFDLHKEIHESDNFYFLSYKKEDVDTLRTIVPHFCFDAWYDFAISYAEAWTESIARHLLNSKAMILFLSKALLRSGEKSFPYLEYQLAKDNNKDILVVYLDDIQNDDVPMSLKFWPHELNTRRCVFYEKDRSVEQLVEEIHTALADIARHHDETPAFHPTRQAVKSAQPLPMEMKCISSFNDDAYLYIGNGVTHLSSDGRRLCLFNRPKNQYEVRVMDDVDILLATIKSKADLSNYQLFYTNDGKFCYYIKGDHIYIYDIPLGKWINPFGTKLPFDKRETPTWLAQQAVGHCVYICSVRDDKITTIIRYDIARNKAEKSWDLKPFHFTNHADFLQDLDVNTIVFTDQSQRLMTLRLNDMEILPANPADIAAYYNRETHQTAAPNIFLSHDGLMYSVATSGGFRVLDTLSGNVIHEDYSGAFRNIYLLRNRTVLKYHLNGTLTAISPGAKRTLFDRDYYLNTPAFGGNTPHTMLYDEYNGNLIYVMFVGDPKNNIHQVVVTDLNGTVRRISNHFKTPLDTGDCDCKLLKNRLLLTFMSAENAKYKKLQNTFLFAGEYQ